MTEERYLDDAELLAIERVERDELKASYDVKIAQRDHLINTLQLQIVELKYRLAKRDLEQSEKKEVDKRNISEKRADSRRAVFKSIAEKYELKDGWGYDPLTGLIILEQEGT